MTEPSRASGATLDALRRRVKEILSGLEHPPLGLAAALAEECGEVARHLLDCHAYGRPLDRPALASELADVLICVCETATAHGIDLDAAMSARLAKLETQVPEWRAAFGEALRRARAAPP